MLSFSSGTISHPSAVSPNAFVKAAFIFFKNVAAAWARLDSFRFLFERSPAVAFAREAKLPPVDDEIDVFGKLPDKALEREVTSSSFGPFVEQR